MHVYILCGVKIVIVSTDNIKTVISSAGKERYDQKFKPHGFRRL